MCDLGGDVNDYIKKAEMIFDEFLGHIPIIRANLKDDVKAILRTDPAATAEEEVVLAYPGFWAISVYRVAHFFFEKGVPLIPRAMTEMAHSETGVDIHPGAEIGQEFCIDHGTGVVIGETAVIGNNVSLYQGVTIGSIKVNPHFGAKQKRHPTIEDNVTIYARTTILGGDTVIGKNSIIGGNVWITESIPENTILSLTSDLKQIQRNRNTTQQTKQELKII